MKKFTLVPFLYTSICIAVTAAPLDEKQYLKERQWSEVKQAHKVASPVRGIIPLMYFDKDTSGPSCSLLLETADKPALLEMTGPDKGETFPQCIGVNDAASFKIGKEEYVVFEYLTRETREDTFSRFYYVIKGSNGQYQSASDLNEAELAPLAAPAKATGINPPRSREGIAAARTIITAKSMTGMEFQPRDYLVDGTRSFAIYKNKINTACTFVVDDGITFHSFAHTSSAQGDTCKEILASGKIESKGSTYFIALYKGATRNHLGVVSVSRGTVQLDDALAVAANSSAKLTTMKQAKTALAAILK